MSNKRQDKIIKSYLNKNRVFGENLKTDIEIFLAREYGKSGINFTPASPYGQILTVLKELNDLQYFYLEDVLNERNVYTAFKRKSIYGLARLTGHNAHRGTSARGEIGLKFKPGATDLIPGNNILINNFTKINCENNSKQYMILLSSDSVFLPKGSNETFRFNIIEGDLRTNQFFGNGESLQSFNIETRTEIIDQHYIKIFINGREMNIKDSLYDIKKDENAVIVKTGINGGIDIYFGNDDYGIVPQIGEIIEVQWINSSGRGGNISVPTRDIVLEFTEEISDGFDGTLDLNELFDITVTKSILMGSDPEDKELTKQLMNKNSRSFVLANNDNYKNFLGRYSQYKHINAYNAIGDAYIEDSNVVHLFILPDIMNRIGGNSDYFTTDESNFVLSNEEKNAIYDTVKKSGQQLISTELVIDTPSITKYALNVFIKVFDDIISEEVVRAEIIDKVGNYFLESDRRDKIPRSDIVSLIEGIEGIDSVYVEFISGKNETAIRNGFYMKKIKYSNEQISKLVTDNLKVELPKDLSVGANIETEIKVKLEEGEDPNLGLDGFGDIIIEENELPLIRGGFLDRNSVEYVEGLSSDNLCGLNIIISGETKRV